MGQVLSVFGACVADLQPNATASAGWRFALKDMFFRVLFWKAVALYHRLELLSEMQTVHTQVFVFECNNVLDPGSDASPCFALSLPVGCGCPGLFSSCVITLLAMLSGL